jgi:hypothetical protein
MDFGNATDADIQEAIDRFGEHDGRYGEAVLDCAKKLVDGDSTGAHGVMYRHATWKARH